MRSALILLALALTLQGCGIRGPLYLPAKPAAEPSASPAGTPTDAREKP